MLVLDTNIIIAYFGGETKVIENVKTWRNQRIGLAISTIAECEILSFPKLSSSEIGIIKQFLIENFVVIPVDRDVAHIAASIRRTTVGCKTADAIIAATAQSIGADLVSRDKQFQKIKKLKVVTL